MQQFKYYRTNTSIDATSKNSWDIVLLTNNPSTIYQHASKKIASISNFSTNFIHIHIVIQTTCLASMCIHVYLHSHTHTQTRLINSPYSFLCFSLLDEFAKYTNPKKVEKFYFVPQHNKSHTRKTHSKHHTQW